MLLGGQRLFGKGGSFCKGDRLCMSFRVSHGTFCPRTPTTQISQLFGQGCGYIPLSELCSLQDSSHGCGVLVGAPSPGQLLSGEELGLLPQPLRRCQQWWGTGMRCCRARLGTGCGWRFSATAEMSWAVSARLCARGEAGGLCHAGLSPFPGGCAASHTGS